MELNENKLYCWGYGKYGQIGTIDYHYAVEPIEMKMGLKDIVEISSGEFHTAVVTNSDLYLFGKNTFGQLGLGHNDIVTTPSIPLSFTTKIVKVSCGGEHTLALTAESCLFSWGFNIFGQLGLNNRDHMNIPCKVEMFRTLIQNRDTKVIEKESIRSLKEGEKILEIAAGAQHSMFLTTENDLYSCGFAKNGSLAYYTNEYDPPDSCLFTKIQDVYSTTKKFSKIACGVCHSGVVLNDTEIMLWGIGDSSSTIYETPTLIQIPSKHKLGLIKEFQIGDNFYIILNDQGELYSAGVNDFGQLGIGSQISKKQVERVIIPDKIKTVRVGYTFVYAVAQTNKVYAWGNNKNGQLLELSTNERIITPKEISLLSGLKELKVSCGGYHVVISTSDLIVKNMDESKLIRLNKQFDPVMLQKQNKYIDALGKKQKEVDGELIGKEKVIKELKLSKQKSAGDIKSNVFDEEIKFEELYFNTNSEIGSGTFGEVKKAHWRKTLVAVKFLKSTEQDDENIKLFIEELNLLKKLRHPNILLYLGACTTGPHYFLVTEYCESGNLFDYLHSNPKNILQTRERIRIAIEIAKGVNYLHSFNPPILHRDLKSLNILLDKNQQVKIADFGWARLRDNYMTKQRGTFQWMAPEVIKKHNYTEKADVYSFGIILWELWVQEPPYKNIERIKVAQKVATDKTYRPRLSEDLQIPEEILALIISCWDYDPDKRPSFNDIVTYLEGELQNYVL
jgi:alpha-tubulin suppressor-like RCC1 family protein